MAREHESFETRMQRVDAALALVRAEIERAARKHPPFNSRHEGYAVLLEEVDELWDDVKADRHHPAIIEAIQVAAMGVRFVSDLGAWESQDTEGPWGTRVEHTLRDPAIVAEQEAEAAERAEAHIYSLSEQIKFGTRGSIHEALTKFLTKR